MLFLYITVPVFSRCFKSTTLKSRIFYRFVIPFFLGFCTRAVQWETGKAVLKFACTTDIIVCRVCEWGDLELPIEALARLWHAWEPRKQFDKMAVPLHFWDYSGPILEHYMPRGSTVTSATYLEHYMPRGSTVTSATYSNLLRENLKPAIRQKRRGLLTTGVCLLHDNARPHTATATVSTIEELLFECIPHPLY